MSAAERFWVCGRFRFSLARPMVMGVLNVTPDSFSDGGAYADADAAISRGARLCEAGADVVDVGGESTRPGALGVSEEEEKRRVLPVIAGLAARGIAVSADTMKPRVMAAALENGAAIVNDVNGFRARGAVEVVAGSDCGVVAMHMRGTPQTMQDEPMYDDVVGEVGRFLAERARVLEMAGVGRERICVDPGIGFGKSLEHNLALLQGLERLRELGGCPVLVGVSRKSFLGVLTGRERPMERDAGGGAVAAVLVGKGGWGFRTHDPAGVRDGVAVGRAVGGGGGGVGGR